MIEPIPSENKLLGKRANRGYNPKYDDEESQFLSKNDLNQLGAKQSQKLHTNESGKKKSTGKSFKANEV